MEINLTNHVFLFRKQLLMNIMRILIFFFCTTFFALTPNDVVSQNSKVKIAEDKLLTVDEVFYLIMDQTNYKFFYEIGIFKDFPKVQVKKGVIKTNDLLEECLSSGNLTVTLTKNNCIVIEKKQSLVSEIQYFQLSGTVSDEAGVPLPGASIVEKGTSKGVLTDFDGNFSIKLSNSKAVLEVSYVGFVSKEIAVNNQRTLEIVLKNSTTDLEEVVIVGYGSVKKKDLTGSVSTVKSESIEKINTGSLNDALQGMAAGVQVTASSGTPGKGSSIIIRGGSSISASNEPLYVIDGFPQLGGDNMDLNPQNIESVTILKDAAAGAIYGARASNGVVLITTKSGSKDEIPKISYTSRFSLANPIKKIETMDIVDYARVQKVINPNPSFYENPETFRDSISVNWQDKIFRPALTQTHDMQISGGSKNSKYSASLGYYNQEGIVDNTSYTRINSRLRLESDISKKLKTGVNISYTSGQSLGPSFQGQGGLGMIALHLRPFIPASGFDGDLEGYEDPTYNEAGSYNPIEGLKRFLVEGNNLRFSTINYLEYEPVKNFTLKTTGSLNYYGSKSKSYQPSDIGFASSYNGIGSIGHNETTSWLFENTANYKLKIANHKIEALAGFSAQSTVGESFSVRSYNFPIETLGYDNIALGVDLEAPKSNKYKATLASLFGRVSYDFRGKYLLNATVRYDGSSNLGADNKWGMFPSAGLAWRVSEESFIKKLNIFTDLKFRASYGLTGNNSIGNYRSLLTYTAANISINSSQVLGQIPNSMPNSDLKWEQNKQLDLGLDLKLFKGKLNFTADYYKKKSKDLLLNAPVPINSGFTTFTNNIGDIQSSGYEFDLGGTIIKNKNLSWTSQFNISFPSTKVLKLSDTDYFFTGSAGRKQNVFKVQEGEPLGSFFGYIYDGVNQNQDEVDNLPQYGGSDRIGSPRYKDISGPDGVPDGIINAFDRTILGNGLPDVFGGLTNSFRYKSFDFSFVFTYRFGNKVLNSNKSELTASANRGGPKYMLNAWSPENPTNELWAWGQDSVLEFLNVTSWLLEDGSFVRLNNITFGYSLPKYVIKKLNIQNFRIFLAGDKILTFSKYKGYDPEVGVSMLQPGIDLTSYPNQKKITVGINITF